MSESQSSQPSVRRVPWNKGKLLGPKPPLRAKHVWTIRGKLQLEGKTRDLAHFNLGIDSKLRGCAAARLRGCDSARPTGWALYSQSIARVLRGHS